MTPNTRLGPYEVVSPLGAGGMGEVYRARDTRLDRDVAIKVLPDAMARDPQALARFEREAKTVAALSHPNIMAVYDVGRHEDISYVIMELLEGETLRSRISRSSLPSRKATEIGIEIAEGLSAAHAKGVIHRDLKPENIFLTAGHVKILDFGLARSTGPVQGTTHDLANSPTMTLETRPGAIIGTLCYMAPEQIRALATDVRTDIFAFGCVMYEMLTGKRAFLGETAADTMTAILKEEPTSVRSVSSGVGLELERLIDRCLEKRPERRFQSSADLAYSLRSLLSHSGIAVSDPARRPWFAHAALALVVVAILIAGTFMVRRELRHARLEGRETIDSIAVLPLENVSRDPEQEYFVDGMTEALISDLAKIGGLKVISRTSVMRYRATTKSLPEIANELNVDAVVEGSVLRVGDRVRITAQLIHAATDEHLWSESYDRDVRDVLRLHSELAKTIAQQIKVTLTPQEQARMVAARPVNPDAHQAYLKGRFHWNKRTPDGLQKAVEYFEKAVSLDPAWPPGYAGLADAYLLMPWYSAMRPSEASPKARAAAAKALEMDESLGEAHASMALIAADYDRDWPTAERQFKRALALNPNYATAHQWYGLKLRFRGRHNEAVRETATALELDPLSLIISVNVGEMHYDMGDLEQAETQFRRTLEFGPDFAEARVWLAHTLFLQDRSSEAITQAKEAVRLSNNDPRCASTLGYLYAKSSETQEARRILDEITVRSREAYVAPTYFAFVHAGLEERDQMFEWLERAYEEYDVRLPDMLIDPLLAEMRSDPRFSDLVRRVGLPPLAVPRGSDPPASPLGKGGQRGVTDGKIMLAVLPFENLSRDPDQDYFSDGLTEEMISQLSRINPKKLGVIARTSAMHYKNTTKTIDAIGRELGVAYILEGSVRRAGERVRITAQLIQVSDQTHLRAENFERDLKDIFALQNDVAERVAGSLTVELLPGEVATAARTRRINLAAHEAYLKGRFHWNKRTPDGIKKAVEYFEQGVALDPDWPLAYAGLADAYLLMPFWAPVRANDAIPKARAAAERALKMDESLAEAHATMAHIATTYDWDWPTGEREYQRALTLSPNYATAHFWYAMYLLFMSRHDEAIREITKAQELDPLSLIIGVNVGRVYYTAGDLGHSETWLRKTLELGPDYAPARRGLGITLFLQGRLEEATVEAREATRLSNNDPYHAAIIGYVRAKAGQPEEGQRALDELATRSTEAYVPPTCFALVHAGLDEEDRLFEWLERAYQERDAWLLYTLIDPLLAEYRGDPRFADLVRRVGLPNFPVTENPADRSISKPRP